MLMPALMLMLVSSPFSLNISSVMLIFMVMVMVMSLVKTRLTFHVLPFRKITLYRTIVPAKYPEPCVDVTATPATVCPA